MSNLLLLAIQISLANTCSPRLLFFFFSLSIILLGFLRNYDMDDF